MPIAGDLFDIVWKANRKNLSLLEDHLGLPRTYDGTARIETGTRFRPKAAPRPVVFGAAAAAASPAESGRTDSFMVRSEIAAGEIDLTRRDFVAGRVVRRSETQISSSGGDGLITTTGGYTSGYVKPVTVTSRTRHINEVWFPREDGTEGFVLLDADRFPLQEGQKITLVFASGKRLRDRMPLIVVRNRSMGRTTSYAADRTINSVTGYSLFSRAGGLFRPANLALLAAPLLFLLSFGSSGDQLTVPGVAFMLAGFGALLFAMTSVTRKRDAFLKEAAAFAEDDTIASR